MEIVRLLCDLGSDVASGTLQNPLTLAIREYAKDRTPSRLKIIHHLLTFGADPHTTWVDEKYYTKYPIETAVEIGDLELFSLLLDFKASIYHGSTRHGICCSTNREIFCRCLLEKGFSMSDEDLVNCAIYQKDDIINLHLEYYSLISVIAPLISSSEVSLTVLKKFLGNVKCDNLDELYDGLTLLRIASRRGKTNAFQYLIERGADVNFRGADQSQALHHAAQHGSFKCCKYLLENGAEVNSRDDDGWTPILFAVTKQNFGVAKLFITYGAIADLKDLLQ